MIKLLIPFAFCFSVTKIWNFFFYPCERKKIVYIFANRKMVDVAQLVRVADCGSVGRGFESHLPPQKAALN